MLAISYFSEITSAGKIVEDLAHEANFSEQFKTFHLADLWHGSDCHLPELRTESGEAVWGPDPVHLTATAYAEVAEALLSCNVSNIICHRYAIIEICYDTVR